MTIAVFAGCQTLLILNIGEFQNFAKILNDFGGIPNKILGKFMDFQSSSTEFPMSSIGAGVDIFWNIPL